MSVIMPRTGGGARLGDCCCAVAGALDDPALFWRAAFVARRRRVSLKKQLKQAKAAASQGRSGGDGGGGGCNDVRELRAMLRPLMDVPPPASDEPPERSTVLCLEYLALAAAHADASPMTCVRFHARRICKEALAKYSLGDRLEAADTIAQVPMIIRLKNVVQLVKQADLYESGEELFKLDPEEQKRKQEAAEFVRRNAAKRREFEQACLPQGSVSHVGLTRA
eukprot:6195922-Pleurochrysis_carterae.AAC.1